MSSAVEQPAAALSGIEPRDEHDLRIWTAIAMWIGGGCAIAAGATVLGARNPHFTGLWALVGFTALAASFTFVVFRRASNATLYVLSNIFSTLGALTVWLACLWSGGAESGLFGLFFFPALYDAYFFRVRQVVPHLLLNSALVLSPLAYAASLRGTQFPARAAVLVLGMWGMSAVVGYRKRKLLLAELNARRQALSDPLTGLHNLRSLRAHASRSEPAEGTGVLGIDIDDFKAVNTAYGHVGADEFLQRVGSALLTLTGASDCVARVGGDEFAIIAHGRTPAEIERLAADCASAVRRASLRAGDGDGEVTASVGYGLCPQDGRSFSELLAAADRSMYSAKTTARTKAADAPAGQSLMSAARGGDRPDGGLAAEPAAAGPRPVLSALPPKDASLRLGAPRRVARWWRARPANAVAGAAAWLGAAVTTLIALLLPDTNTVHRSMLIALILYAVAMAPFVLLLAPLIGRGAYLVSDALGACSVALGVYLTGGTNSPLLPLIFFAVTVAAYFKSPREALLRLVGSVLICASPFAYADAEQRLLFTVRFIAIATTAAVLVAIILYNKRELAQAEQTSRRLASHDPLTGLPNRRAFQRLVEDALAGIRDDVTALLAVSIIDLDNFKRVNDEYGHAAGDRVLKAIASALTAVTRAEDSLTRIGGDEFALILAGADASVARLVGERCVRAVEEAVVQAGYGDCGVSATVGYAVAPYHAATLDALVEAADAALMRAKCAGKRTVARAGGRPAGQRAPRSITIAT